MPKEDLKAPSFYLSPFSGINVKLLKQPLPLKELTSDYWKEEISISILM